MYKNKSKASYPDEESDWKAWKEEELLCDDREEEAQASKSSKDNN